MLLETGFVVVVSENLIMNDFVKRVLRVENNTKE